jgi:hypothetical protein
MYVSHPAFAYFVHALLRRLGDAGDDKTPNLSTAQKGGETIRFPTQFLTAL